ncbi:MAG: hypothetical protein GY771_12840, partial [bacterium]|nr:hypothetical protein [bacterium]
KKGVKSYDELTKNLAGHIETEVLDSAPTTRRPKRLTKPAVVFFGGLYTKLCYDTGKSVDEISKLAVPDVFTGIIAALTSQSIGYMFFIGGKKLGEAAINDDGITACEGAATGLFEEAVQIEAYKYPEGIMPPYIALANGARAIARVSATAVNIDKFVPWAEEKELTCFIWINDNRHTANILIKKGKILGGLTELSSDLNPVIDDALAIFYSVGAEVEIFSV